MWALGPRAALSSLGPGLGRGSWEQTERGAGNVFEISRAATSLAV